MIQLKKFGLIWSYILKVMNFFIFEGFFWNFSEFKIDFTISQLTWQNLERLIPRLILIVDLYLKQGVRGAFLLVGESFLKRFNLSR